MTSPLKQMAHFQNNSTEMFMALYQNCSKGSTPLNKMATRAKNSKKRNKKLTSPLKPMAQFQNNFAEIFLL